MNLKNYNVKDTVEMLIKVAREYDRKLNDKHFMIVYYHEGHMCIAHVGFRNINFLHLTGVRTKLSAQRFYEACLNGKLGIDDVDVDRKGKTQLKLNVLRYLPDLLYNNCMIGNFVNNGFKIQADYFVGDTKAVLSVGFRIGKRIDIPISLYNESVKVLTRPTCKVYAIFVKNFRDIKYSICTYLSKGYQIEQLSNEIRALLDEKVVVGGSLS